MSASTSSSRVIISWIGGADVRSMQSGSREPGRAGPIRTLTDNLPAERIFLLVSKEMEEFAEDMRAWVKDGLPVASDIVLEKTALQDPTSYQDVYDVTEQFFTRWRNKSAASLVFNLTPGTPTMQAVMLYFSQVRYPDSKAYQTLNPQYIKEGELQYREITLPFKLSQASWRFESADALAEDERSTIMAIFAPVPTVSILLSGETGVGKSYFAKEIHEASGQKGKFISVNCGLSLGGDTNSLRSELFGHVQGSYTGATKNRNGAFIEAQGGTLFLDEIGEIPLNLQSTLLMALEEKKISPLGSDQFKDVSDVRIISATNKNLLAEVRAGRFREDLYSRLAMLPVHLPSLREVAKSQPVTFKKIVDDCLLQINIEIKRTITLSSEAFEILCAHRLPGNRRQLHHVLLLAAIVANYHASSEITAQLLKHYLNAAWPTRYDEETNIAFIDHFADIQNQELPSHLESWLENIRFSIINEALRRSQNNISKASKLLGMTYQRLDYYLKNKNKK